MDYSDLSERAGTTRNHNQCSSFTKKPSQHCSPQIQALFPHFISQPIIWCRGPRPKAHWCMHTTNMLTINRNSTLARPHILVFVVWLRMGAPAYWRSEWVGKDSRCFQVYLLCFRFTHNRSLKLICPLLFDVTRLMVILLNRNVLAPRVGKTRM